MAVRSIIDIDVNDQSFQKFTALWQQFQRQLQQTPIAWNKIVQSQSSGLKTFKEMVAEQALSIQQARMEAEAQKVANRLLQSNADKWRDIRRNSASAVRNVKDMTLDLIKWTGLIGAVSGLLGSGGLWGISRMAQSVATGRRSALGIGATYGQQKAFGNAFERLVDPQTFLSGVEDALTDVRKRVALTNAGLGEEQLGGGSAAVGSRLIDAIKRLADQTPEHELGNVLDARHLDQFITLDQFRAIKRTDRGEIADLQRRNTRAAKDYNLDDGTQKSYQDFTTALGDAGIKIENVFVRGLAPLIPGLTQFSEVLAGVVTNLFNAIPKDWGDTAGKGLVEFGKHLASPDFQNNVKNFIGAIGTLAQKTVTVASFLGFIPSHEGEGAKGIRDRVKWGKQHSIALAANRWGKSTSIADSVAAWGKSTSISDGVARWVKPDAENKRTLEVIKKGNSERSEPKTPTDVSSMGRTASITVKESAGIIDPGLARLIEGMSKSINGMRITAGKDKDHEGFKSPHNVFRAFDFTIPDPSKHAEVAAAARQYMKENKIRGRVIDEYDPAQRSKHWNGDHIHVQTDVRVTNMTGNNVIVSANQVTPVQ